MTPSVAGGGGPSRARRAWGMGAAFLLLVAVAPAHLGAQRTGAVPDVVVELSGSWEGSGELMGRPAHFGMTWQVAGGGFVRLSFRNGWVGEDGSRIPVLSSEATYLFRGATGIGVWVDDRPQRITLEVTATDSSLVSMWTAESEAGRTEYVVEGDGVRVRDFVLVDGAERLFAEATYRRTEGAG